MISCCAALWLAAVAPAAYPQAAAQNLTAAEKSAAAGDDETQVTQPANLSPRLSRHAVADAMRLVADWQLRRAEPRFNQDWTFAALYAGFMAVPAEVSGAKYQEAMLAMGKKFAWQPGPRPEHADDQAIGQTYIELYLKYRDPAMIAPIRQRMESLTRHVDDPDKLLWWWCDALFMAPPVLSDLYAADRKISYLDFMDREWWITSGKLYDPVNHLFYRDASYLNKRESNGKPIFWSRGNGWVIAGLARVLSEMPADYPSRGRYVTQFRQMASAIAALQGRDGLWRPGLLDAEAYPLPEVSGSAFYTYALAYGINHGLLDKTRYLPVVQKGWAGLLSHVYADGRLGCIQPVGAAPGAYTAASSYVFGVGAYLFAGSEVYKLSTAVGKSRAGR
ncbi:MAG TPA: glycoside hydrolase family 88 protein [Acidobacteriaceae bacterium]|nr:glycoside hydrolase family 88 protein [Acidobacteriaceae bacterium]